MSSSAIFSANAFGGNGGPRTETTNDTDNRTWKCVADGPFEKLRPAYVSTKYAPHCLSRDVDFTSTKFRNDYTAASIAGILASDTFGYFATSLESNPHNQIYMDLGGDMDEDSSPNDPLFFLHHVQVDRLWWLWQQEKPGTRNREYNGIREMTVDEDGWPTFEGPDAKL
jgi:tyrosinase